MIRPLTYLRTVLRNRAGKTDLPRFLTYIVTYRCNARCIMCDSWKLDNGDELSTDEIEKIFKQLPRLDGLRLSGGEPFLRKDLDTIAALAETHLDPFMFHITSNGFLTDTIVSFLQERRKKKPLYLLLSIDGLEKNHDRIRGVDRAFQRVTRTLEQLAPRQKELNIKIGINQTVVDEQGARDYRELKAYLEPLDVQHNLVMAYDVSATYSTDRGISIAPESMGDFTTFGDFSQDDIIAFLQEVESDTSGLPFAERAAKKYYFQGITSRLARQDSVLNPPCVALSSHMRLMPDGTVPVCQFNSTAVGNLRDQGFKDAWFGLEAEKKRNWVRNCPGCWAECEVLPNAVYSGDIIQSAVLNVMGK